MDALQSHHLIRFCQFGISLKRVTLRVEKYEELQVKATFLYIETKLRYVQQHLETSRPTGTLKFVYVVGITCVLIKVAYVLYNIKMCFSNFLCGMY